MGASTRLNERFAVPGHLVFKETPGGVTVAEISNAQADAAVCLQGAHLMTWRPVTQIEPVVWLSPAAKLAPGKSIRGGVPVCWPWFGPHATEKNFPAHGFARTVPWEVAETGVAADGATIIALALVDDARNRAMWPHRTRLSLRIVVGESLKMTLATTNLDAHDIVIGEALHTYFHIGDIAGARVRGLEDTEYLDKVENFARRRQRGAVTFSGETDRVYVGTGAACVIEDDTLERRIIIEKTGGRSTVVWNPWAEKAEKMGDLGPDGWRRMVCVESANALDDRITIKPGETHELTVAYRAERC